MFDTNIFNHLRDGATDLTPFIGKAKFLVTHIQLDELNNTRDEARRVSLSQLFEEITSGLFQLNHLFLILLDSAK